MPPAIVVMVGPPPGPPALKFDPVVFTFAPPSTSNPLVDPLICELVSLIVTVSTMIVPAPDELFPPPCSLTQFRMLLGRAFFVKKTAPKLPAPGMLLNSMYLSDAASGAGYVESLTHDLCEKAWEIFQVIEKSGKLPVFNANNESSDPLIGTKVHQLPQEFEAAVEAVS